MKTEHRQTLHLLVVEDEELDIIALERAFAKHRVSYEFSVARDGAAAFQWLCSVRGEEIMNAHMLLILLDINMPRMNGIEFLAKLRSDAGLNQIPVFVLTTSDEHRDISAAYSQGISGYLLKQKIGDDFEKLISLLNAYAEVVLFPA